MVDYLIFNETIMNKKIFNSNLCFRAERTFLFVHAVISTMDITSLENKDPLGMCEEFRCMKNIVARMNFCVAHRVVLSKKDCLFVAVVFCIVLVINNEKGEVWNMKAMLWIGGVDEGE